MRNVGKINMYCSNCGTENSDNARFCKQCGAELAAKQECGNQEKAKEEYHKSFPREKRLFFCIVALFGLIVLSISGILIAKDKNEKQEYDNYIATGERYVEELDYDKAEDAYLKAIAIDPKKEKPYIELADIYFVQEEFDKAEGILVQAVEAVPEADGQEAASSNEKAWKGLSEKLDDVQNMTQYTWDLEPQIAADALYYIKDNNGYFYSQNALQKQMESYYAVIKKDNTYGLIGMDGSQGVPMEYSKIGGIASYYSLVRKQAKYEAEDGIEMKDYYFVEDTGEIKPAVAVVGDVEQLPGAFYYCDGLHNIAEDYSSKYLEIPETTIPVKNSGTLFDKENNPYENYSEWIINLNGQYAIYKEDALVTDFIYEECGTASSGLLAVKQNGKWGYVNEEGKIVIPIEYDASWNEYVPYENSTTGETKAYCYAATEGFVTLCKDGEWELRYINGKIAIPTGVFEEIRPVYEGKCWVKKNGKWGVISLGIVPNSDAEPKTGAEVDANKANEHEEKDVNEEVSKLTLEEGTYEYSDGEFLSELRVRVEDGKKICYFGEWYNYGAAASVEDFEFTWVDGKFDYEVTSWRSKNLLQVNIELREQSIVISIVNTEGTMYSTQGEPIDEFKAEYTLIA